MTTPALPNNGDTGWGTELNNYITNVVLAEANETETSFSAHAANSPADPHGDRAYALSLMSPVLNGLNQPNGLVQLNSGGLIPSSLIPPATPAAGSLGLLTATPAAGVALQNGTPTILSWVAPSDGNNHRVELFGELVVASAETGGQVSATYTDPAGNAHTVTLVAAGQGTGAGTLAVTRFVVEQGSTFTVTQSTALTAGTATLWCEIWGS